MKLQRRWANLCCDVPEIRKTGCDRYEQESEPCLPHFIRAESAFKVNECSLSTQLYSTRHLYTDDVTTGGVTGIEGDVEGDEGGLGLVLSGGNTLHLYTDDDVAAGGMTGVEGDVEGNEGRLESVSAVWYRTWHLYADDVGAAGSVGPGRSVVPGSPPPGATIGGGSEIFPGGLFSSSSFFLVFSSSFFLVK